MRFGACQWAMTPLISLHNFLIDYLLNHDSISVQNFPLKIEEWFGCNAAIRVKHIFIFT
jgi:hypothetical protein